MNEADRHFPDETRPRYQEPSTDVDRVELLKKRLYSRLDPLPRRKQVNLKPIDRGDKPGDWGDELDLDPLRDAPSPKRNPFLVVFAVASLFFVGAAVYAGFVWFGRLPGADGTNVVLEVTGPTSVKGGEPVALEIVVANRNDVAMEFVDLTLEFPEGTKSEDLSQDLRRQTIQIGTIAAGEVAKRDVEVVLYGKEQSIQEIEARVTYRLPGSVSVFDREKPFSLTLTKSPLSAIAVLDKEVTSGQTLDVVVDVVSNSDRPIEGALLRVDYPFGFEVLEESEPRLGSPGLFDMGDFQPGQKKQVRIVGRVTGADGEQRTFRVSSGLRSSTDKAAFATTFSTDLATIRVVRPFLNVEFVLAGSDEQVVAVNAERGIRGYFIIRNDLDVEVVNVTLDAKLSGDVLERRDVSPTQGYYRSADNTLLWDKTTAKELTSLKPGDEARLGFGFGVKNLYNVETEEIFRNPEMYLSMTARAQRVSERDVPEDIENTVERVVKVNSSVGLSAKSVFSVGPFTNTGPLPPEIETPTTYTMHLEVDNTSNALANVVFKGSLPPYVEWMDSFAPRDEAFSYDPVNRIVTWKVGDVPAGSGYSLPSVVADFQISAFPSVTQAMNDLDLVVDPELVYYDRFTGQTLRIEEVTVTSKIDTDPIYKPGIELVKDPSGVVR